MLWHVCATKMIWIFRCFFSVVDIYCASSLRERPICRLIYIFSHPNQTTTTTISVANFYKCVFIYQPMISRSRDPVHVWMVERVGQKKNCATANSARHCVNNVCEMLICPCLILGQCVKSAQIIESQRRPDHKKTHSPSGHSINENCRTSFFFFIFNYKRPLVVVSSILAEKALDMFPLFLHTERHPCAHYTNENHSCFQKSLNLIIFIFRWHFSARIV